MNHDRQTISAKMDEFSGNQSESIWKIEISEKYLDDFSRISEPELKYFEV